MSAAVEIALFPIPECVTLPFTVVPLHVFEPRYRKMIKDAVASRRRIGVAHTQRVVAEPKQLRANISIEEMLNHNQKTYLPYPIFSAGFAEIIETLPDERMLIEIVMDCRYQLGEELQSIPYKIFRCHPFEDDATAPSGNLRQELDRLLLGLANDQAGDLKTFLQSREWREQSLLEYSFKIFSVVQFEADVMQKVLELRSPTERIQFLKDVLSRGEPS